VLRFLPVAFVLCAVLAAVAAAADPSSGPAARPAAAAAQVPSLPLPAPATPPPAQTAPGPAPATSTAPAPAPPRSGPRLRSRAVGLPYRGKLVRGVPLPLESDDYVTWDPVRRDSPNRAWRTYATDRLVALVQRVSRAFQVAHPGASRIAVGDLSLPRGGNFGPQYGGLGHGSHQNGLDVDVYYPRKDGCECAPLRPSEVDQLLGQDLVDRFVAAGAQYVFVGPHLRLTGPHRVVQKLAHHDDHLHVRIPNVSRGVR
jgi:hypothetical protein